jgi:uncharacterized membrane protein YhaH (DUF805 family)
VDFRGRAARTEFWMFTLFYVLFVMILIGMAGIFATALTDDPDDAFFLAAACLVIPYQLAMLLPSLAVSARRLHDVGRNGWWLLLSLVPYVGNAVILVFTCLKSRSAANRWGEVPAKTVYEKFSRTAEYVVLIASLVWVILVGIGTSMSIKTQQQQEEEEAAREQMEEEEEARAQMQEYLADGDACFARSDYECAKNNYERYRDTSMSGKQDISRKLENSGKAYLARRAADNYYTAGNYASAKEKYNEVLSLHPEDSRSQEYSSISSVRLQPGHTVGAPGQELEVTNKCSSPVAISIYFMNNATNQ